MKRHLSLAALLAARLAFGAVTKSKRVTKLAVTKMGRAAASLGLFPLAADASISCAASLLCFTGAPRSAANQPRRVMKTIAFVSWQIVDDDDISGPQRWRQR